MNDILLAGISVLHIALLIFMIVKTKNWFDKLDNHVEAMDRHISYIDSHVKSLSRIGDKYVYLLNFYALDIPDLKIYLLHDKKFSEDEFRSMIHEAVKSIVRKTKSRYVALIYKYHDIVTYLKNNFGFEEISPIINWEIIGDANILEDNQRVMQYDKNYKYLREFLKEVNNE